MRRGRCKRVPRIRPQHCVARARRITIVTIDGATAPRVLLDNSQKRRRGSPWLRPFATVERHLLRAGQAYGDELLRRHDRSNSKKADGWIIDAPRNVYKASTRAYRAFRKVAPRILLK